jgi:surface protein
MRVALIALAAASAAAQTCTDSATWALSSGGSGGCEDSSDWSRSKPEGADCAWVAADPAERCKKKSDDKVKASEGCCVSCGGAATTYDCAWVAGDPGDRCDAVEDVDASAACAATCGTGAEDSHTWYRKKTNKNCAWLAKKPAKLAKRCKKRGADPAAAACAASCDPACGDTDNVDEFGVMDDCTVVDLPCGFDIHAAVRAYVDDACAAVGVYGEPDFWDTSCYTDFDGLFEDLNVDGVIDPAGWDVSNVENLNNAFRESDFNGDLSSWDTGNVTSMRYTFYKNTAVTGESLAGWNTAKVESTPSMFYGATAFNGDLSDWDVDEVTYMANMFRDATAFDRDLDWCVSNSEATDFSGSACEDDNCGVIGQTDC